ncbi:Lysine (K)specific methyltransferase 2E [Caligus rogercresseyi]|uniref:Lysine (K)specific methyltransferase 2E n=1 Tax=Caligus rogercresseyi TaxID=217165 RepID=A0A7T8GV74_CALRO|nr:Lysine (K)specific methyltransferase 2E [Caligus rogercresseyi]
MGLDRNNIPEEYLCEVCKPRTIDRKRAKSLQARRRSEIFKHSSSSDDDDPSSHNSSSSKKTPRNSSLPPSKKLEPSVWAELEDFLLPLKRTQSDKSSRRRRTLRGKSGPPKRTTVKRKSLHANNNNNNNNNSLKKITTRRSRLSSSSIYHEDDEEMEEEEEDLESDELEPKSWIDQYEEAVTNHYSPELRARLSGHKMALGNYGRVLSLLPQNARFPARETG